MREVYVASLTKGIECPTWFSAGNQTRYLQNISQTCYCCTNLQWE